MKKKLLGVASLGLASLALAGGVDPTKDPKAGTTVFTNDQKGCITIEGKLLKVPEAPKTKYIVFAEDEYETQKEDVLRLADFIVSGEVKDSGFVGCNPQVVVRRVIDGEIAPLENEEVRFSVHNKTLKNLDERILGLNDKIVYDIYQLMARDNLIRTIGVLNEKHSIKEKGMGYGFDDQQVVLTYNDGKSVQEFYNGKSVVFKNVGGGKMLVYATEDEAERKKPKVPMNEELQKELAESLVDTAVSINGGSEVVIYIK